MSEYLGHADRKALADIVVDRGGNDEAVIFLPGPVEQIGHRQIESKPVLGHEEHIGINRHGSIVVV